MLRLRSITRRTQFIVLGVVLTLTLTFILTSSTYKFVGEKLSNLASVTPTVYNDMEACQRLPEQPPTWNSLREWEASLPQHNLDLPFPEGKEGRYVRFSNRANQLGWNNVLNGLLMEAHLAYISNRSYVFHEYAWNQEHYTWPKSQWRTTPPRTPLNALISGPAAGGPFDPNNHASPRAVSDNFFEVVCPPHKRKYLHTENIKPKIGGGDGIDVLNSWAKILQDEPANCVDIIPPDLSVDGFPQTFDLWLWGSDRILSLWEPFTKSPISRLLGTSPVVSSAIDANHYLFFPQGPASTSGDSSSSPHNPFSRVLAAHIRRGDYKEQCKHLAYWNSTFYSWNLLPDLPDPYNPPPNMIWNSDEYNQFHRDRCFPEAEAIVKKIRDSRDIYGRDVLDTVYLGTNAKGEWLASLKEMLKKDGWSHIVTSEERIMNVEQMDVNNAIDMDIARRAGVFIGNGWSSFTSNIIYRRMMDGNKPISNRFW